jgi:hypothetical protein
VQSDIKEGRAEAQKRQQADEAKRGKRAGGAINVTDSGELLLLLKGATPAPGQKFIVKPETVRDPSAAKPGAAEPPIRPKPNAPQPLKSASPPDRR